MRDERSLVLVLDVSGSMDEPVRKDGTLMSKMEKLKLEINDLMKIIGEGTEIIVFSLGDCARLIYQGNDKEEALAEIEDLSPGEGSTAIWGSLEEVLEHLKTTDVDQAIVACITDGEDNASLISRLDITDEYKRYPGLELKVLILNELLGDREILEEEPEGEVVHIRDFSQIKDILRLDDKKLVQYTDLPINATVLNLSEGGEQVAEAAGKAMRKIVPFLEKATGLRYYPVPTVIVDRSIARQVGVTVKEFGQISSVDPSEVFVEIAKLISGVSIAFHTRRLHLTDRKYDKLLEKALEEYYVRYLTDLDSEKRHIFVGLAEAIGYYINKYGEGDWEEVDEGITKGYGKLMKEKAFRSASGFDFLMKALLRIAKTIRDINEQLQDQVMVSEAYFESFHRYTNTGENAEEVPDLEIWSRYADEQQMRTLRDSLKPDGTWIKKASILSIVLEIAVDILRRAFRDLARFKLKFMRVIDELRAFGCYVPAGEGGRKWLNQMLFLAGASDEVSFADTGYVLLYKDVCLEKVGYSPDSPSAIDSEIWPALLDSVLCHEHFHAITEEGIDKDGKSGSCSSVIGTEPGSIVSESTAEWSEIEFNRENEEMMKITVEHATSGRLPGWPYRGAIIIEEKAQKDGIEVVTEAVRAFREGDADKAYELIAK